MSTREKLTGLALRAIGRALIGLERITSGVAYDPLRRESLDDPYPMYRALRERDPVHRSRLIGGWVLSRYADVASLLRDTRFSADERNANQFEANMRRVRRAGIDDEYNPSMLRLDPPDHTRLRGLVSRAFTPRAIERLRPRIEAIVAELLDAAASAGRFDVIRDLAYPLPVTVIAEMLGIPPADRERFKHWSDEIAGSLGFASLEQVRRADRAGRELEAYLAPIFAERRREPRDDLISGLVQAEQEGDRLSEREVYATITLILVAGNETTTNLIGNGMLALLRHPEQLEELRRSPERMEAAVEELLRFDSPVQATSRIPKEDVELAEGRVARRGQQVIVLLGSANRDPEAFPDPDRLDLRRRVERHLSFGLGGHFCLGAQLARLEARSAFAALVQRFPTLKLEGAGAEWGDNMILRGLRRLPVRV